MDAGMKQMMEDMHAPGYSGNPDVDFLAMMIPHHEGAVEMARLALIYGTDPLTRRLAEEIIASQTAEIAAMKERLAILRRGASRHTRSRTAMREKGATKGGFYHASAKLKTGVIQRPHNLPESFPNFITPTL
jgi:hypothetical protein